MAAERGLFIRVEIGEGCTATSDGCRLCVDACPVDIFAQADGLVAVGGATEDECTLCDLCVTRCPPQVVTIHKLYEEDDARAVSR